MGVKEDGLQLDCGRTDGMDVVSTAGDRKLSISGVSNSGTDKDAGPLVCRVCHCVEADLRGESALGLLGIVPPSQEPPCVNNGGDSSDKGNKSLAKKDDVGSKNDCKETGGVEFISPEGEIFVCSTDVESGPLHQEDVLVNLGCSCRNELAVAHYACALKWFISHGCTICEICGNVAVNIRPDDFNKVLVCLRDYEALRERTATGEVPHLHHRANTGVDPDALAGIRRQRLSEISLWFNPHNSQLATSQGNIQREPVSPSNNSLEHIVLTEREEEATRWSMEGSGVFVAIGLGTIVLAWLVAPHVGKKAAVIGLHMLLGGLCALTVMIFLRYVIPRIQLGPMRYWAVLYIFWFLVFGVWISRTHSIRFS